MGQTVFELLAAKRRVSELETEVANLKALVAEHETEEEEAVKPEIEVLSLHPNKVSQEISGLGLKLMYPSLMDGWQPYYYTSEEGWAEVFYYIYTVFNMPSYIAGRMDCEDFGILLKGLVSALFGLNYFGFTIGQIPQGCHGFNFFRTGGGFMVLEPQSAEFFLWGERDYKPEWALL